MIKVLMYLFSFIMGRYNSVLKPSTLVLVDQLLLRTRKLMMTSMVSLIASLLLTGGVVISLIEFTRQIDQFKVVWPSATLIGGLTLSVLALTVLVYSFTSRAFDLRYVPIRSAKKGNRDDTQTRTHSPLEEALSVLVLDFVNERKASRTKEEASAPPKEKVSENVSNVSSADPRSTYENTTLQ